MKLLSFYIDAKLACSPKIREEPINKTVGGRQFIVPRYSDERKAAVLKKLLPPVNRSVPDVAKEESISEQTLYNWRKQLRNKGLPVPGNEPNSEQWSAETRFAVVVETATLSEAELSEYCRKKGLYPQQVHDWKQACISGAVQAGEQARQDKKQAQQDRKRIQKLESELRRKDKALVETAALLVLSKKLDALALDIPISEV